MSTGKTTLRILALTAIAGFIMTACNSNGAGSSINGGKTGSSGNNSETNYNIGDTGTGGGKIFYKSEVGFIVFTNASGTTGTICHYLECAPFDHGNLIFAPYSSPVYDNFILRTSERIGEGRRNTAIIIAAVCNPVVDAPAANACYVYSNNGKTDWFLPSKDELNELFKNKNDIGISSMDHYWSSSMSYSRYAWSQYFLSGWQYNYESKHNASNVRAIRAF